MPLLRYGLDARLSLELDAPALVAVCDPPRGEPLADVRDAARKSLAAPVDYPPLAQAALPGDRVVLALEAGVPQAAAIVAAAVESLLAAGVAAADIVLLRASDDGDPCDPRSALPDDLRQIVTVHVHNPADRNALSYLAADADARPIYISRLIHDADLLLTIGVLRPPAALGYHGINSALFPTFSDAESLKRYRAPTAPGSAKHEQFARQADEVGWLVGLQFTIQVVPGRGNDVLHVVAGDVDAVRVRGARLCEEAWACAVPERVSLVVATLEGGCGEQTWRNVGRALAAAARVLADDGAVVILSELAEAPGPGLQRIRGADNPSRAAKAIAQDRPRDALEATALVHALERGKVYLLSRLDDESVEELGLTPLDERGVARAVARYRTCLVLANAPHVHARPASESLAAAAGRHPTRS